MFGITPPPQHELSPMRPQSPYGIAKLAAYYMTKLYRDGYGLFASNGILFNHESERRGETFVTMKIVRGCVRVKLGKQDKLVLGNLEARRDWGHSKDYMRAIIKILEHHEPDDFAVATGEHYSIREFLDRVCAHLGLVQGNFVEFDSKYTRPQEVPDLRGDPTKIKSVLGWEPEIGIDDLIDRMVQHVMKQETGELESCTTEPEVCG
jgi:GDPmannose 4,6-dehydratase